MLLRTAILALALALAPTVAFATDLMTPNDIKATFFNGQPFTASSPTGAKFKMTFTPDGKALREPLNAAAASAVSAKPAAAKPAAAKATGKKAAGAKASGAGAADPSAAGASAAGASAAGASAAGESAAANAGTPGTWRLSPAGFCTSWAGAKPSCFLTLAPDERQPMVGAARRNDHQRQRGRLVQTITVVDNAARARRYRGIGLLLRLQADRLDEGPGNDDFANACLST